MRSPEEEQATDGSKNVLIVLSFPKALFGFLERLVRNVLIGDKQSLKRVVRLLRYRSFMRKTHLLDNETTETMSQENDRPLFLLSISLFILSKVFSKKLTLVGHILTLPGWRRSLIISLNNCLAHSSSDV
jgi:hypothetical protein